MTQEQIILNFAFNKDINWTDFETSSQNKVAIDWLVKWPKWLNNGLVIYGDSGCGKSHLGNLWANSVNAKRITPNTDINELIKANDSPPHFLLDGIKNIENREVDTLHLINHIKEVSGTILILDINPTKNWNLALKDLTSRLLAMNCVELLNPDDELLTTVLINQLRLRGLVLERQDKVCKYIIERSQRTFHDILKFIENLDNLSLKTKKPITTHLIKTLFEQAQA